MTDWLILAQTPTVPAKPGTDGGQMLLLAVMFALVTFMLLTGRSQKKREQRDRESMYSRLSKNDRVLTLGGIIGTVVSVKDNEVVIKVDESTNTKMTFIRSAIQRILSEDPNSAADKT